ncbi:MAG TPA: hypothetical protein VMV49_17290 [Candidatus Deferrimicrobium sp.]|nr:hypothetical protein [Candidatus Deferrimicrobium sp.]
MSLRPGGVTGIAAIFLIFGALILVIGVICAVATAFVLDLWLNNIDPMIAGLPLIGSFYTENIAHFFDSTTAWLLIGIGSIAIGALDIVTFLGLLKLKKWGYWLAIIISIPLIVVIVGIIFIWYLRKDEVKAAFNIM